MRSCRGRRSASLPRPVRGSGAQDRIVSALPIRDHQLGGCLSTPKADPRNTQVRRPSLRQRRPAFLCQAYQHLRHCSRDQPRDRLASIRHRYGLAKAYAIDVCREATFELADANRVAMRKLHDHILLFCVYMSTERAPVQRAWPRPTRQLRPALGGSRTGFALAGSHGRSTLIELERALVQLELDRDGIVAGEAGRAEVIRRSAGGAHQPLQREIPE